MTLDLNDGSRPSLLELGRRATGELPCQPDPLTRAALEEARQAVKPLDLVVLRAHAVRLAEAPAPVAVAAPSWTERLRGWWLASALIPVLAAGLVFVQPPRDGIRTKGGLGTPESVVLDYLLLQGDTVVHSAPGVQARPGDRIQFRYEARGNEALVLLSVDGEGTLSVFWPEAGEVPEGVQPEGEQLLEGSLILDDAPGPEAFLAIFGVDAVSEARAMAAEAWQRDGLSGLEALATEDDAIDLVVLERAR